MAYQIAEIAAVLKAQVIQMPRPGNPIAHLLLDSRQVVFPDTSLFFALSGRRLDGHDFAHSAYQQGVRHFVLSHLPPNATTWTGATILQVPNTLDALQQLAAWHRAHFDLPVVGITGSNGKTIVKEWLSQLLHPFIRLVRNPRSYNSQSGVPLSVWQLDASHELAIFEAGISKKGEMEKLARIIKPNIGVLTNIGPAHDEGFADRREKLMEKLRLFERAQVIVACRDQAEIWPVLVQKFSDRQLFSWSQHDKTADLYVASCESQAKGTRLIVHYQSQQWQLLIPFSDKASVENALHCLAVLCVLGYTSERVLKSFAQLETVAMRLELKEGIRNCLVINDSYNADLGSLSIALQFLTQQGNRPKRTLILSDILQSGQPAEVLYRQVAELVRECHIDRLIGVGGQVHAVAPYLPKGVYAAFFETTEQLIQAVDEGQLSFQDEAVLIKGARPFAFERIANRLAHKVHNAVLEVHLGAMVHNLSVFSRHLRPGVRIMAMVKAAAYGSGGSEVARLLEFHNIGYLGVAYADEGVELRRAGISAPILVLNPEEAAFGMMERYALEPELYSVSLIRRYVRFVQTQGTVARVHLKLDTGMHRLGLSEGELDEAIALLQSSSPFIQVGSVFSHLAASEDPVHDAFTHTQARRFEAMYARIASALGYRPLRHILNSAGILRFPQYQWEMVRLGIGLYGIDSSGMWQGQLRPALVLKARVSQLKYVAVGETVGYGRSWRAARPTRIATVTIGYADGLPRAAGQGQYALYVRGQYAPIVGNVCMDMCMIDVTNVPHISEGDEVEIFGLHQPVEALAKKLRTIPYELFTRVSPRVPRVYVQE